MGCNCRANGPPGAFARPDNYSAAHCTQSFPRLLFHGSNLAFSSQSNLGDRPDQCYVSWPVGFF